MKKAFLLDFWRKTLSVRVKYFYAMVNDFFELVKDFYVRVKYFYAMVNDFFEMVKDFYQQVNDFYELVNDFFEMVKGFYELLKDFCEMTEDFYVRVKYFFEMVKDFYAMVKNFYVDHQPKKIWICGLRTFYDHLLRKGFYDRAIFCRWIFYEKRMGSFDLVNSMRETHR